MRNLESRLDALEKISGRDCTDVVIRRLAATRDVPMLKALNGAGQWLRSAGETSMDFKQRAFSEADVPAHGMRLLILEGHP